MGGGMNPTRQGKERKHKREREKADSEILYIRFIHGKGEHIPNGQGNDFSYVSELGSQQRKG